MPAFVTVNDFRWQFIAGDKYFVLGTIRTTGAYVAGGVPLLFQDQRNPVPVGSATIKASRAPWFAMIPNNAGHTYTYLTPSQIHNIDPPNTVGTAGMPNATVFVSQPSDINTGLLQIYTTAGVEFSGAMDALPPTTGLFIFQGME